MSLIRSTKIERSNEEEINDMITEAFTVWKRHYKQIHEVEYGKTHISFRFGSKEYKIGVTSKRIRKWS